MQFLKLKIISVEEWYQNDSKDAWGKPNHVSRIKKIADQIIQKTVLF